MEKDLIAEKLEEHDKRLDRHDDKIETLEKNDAVNNTRIDNLCKSLYSLVSTLKWLSGFILTGILTLVLYIIQKAIFKA
ncbi:hemolysin XhlA family protein [Clostridium sp. BL-8]|uniref:hemolysin XhlA family protein n=1 Tax=Clostridium sp. BL-8 TaxID=349938 RepID=UPI00098CD2EA|nr:hemolysin XhlA family protein [Clostridium sp. BL-8]OOM76564.1 hemolysin XhlA [Clostridium sp. BL-8]